MFIHLYALSPITYIVFFLAVIVIWTIVSCVMYKYDKVKTWKIINFIFFVLSLLLVLWYTVFGRHPGTIQEIHFNPCDLFEQTKEQPEIYRSMFMNVMLFVPFGIFLPFIFRKEKILRNFLITTLSGFLCSVIVESIQYIFAFGQADSADVLCNLLGVIIGSIAYILSMNIIREIKKV